MAKKFNNQHKGDYFENLVFKKLKELIKNQDIPGVSRYNEIFLHKQYASKTAPDVMLNPDITIEVYSNSNKETWSNLLVVECKNHGRKIDNSIYREFVGNLSDYPRSGVRGIMVSSAGFTQQVITLAQSDNIALVVLSEQSDWETIIWRKINSFEQHQFGHKVLTGEASTSYPIVYSGNSFVTVSDLLQECGIPMSKALHIPFMEDNVICKKVEDILQNTKYLIKENFIDCCFSLIAPNYKFDFVEMQEDCLGKCDFKEHVITINSSLSKHRQNFTIAHELGHIALHSSIVENLFSIEDRESDKNTIISKSIYGRMEYQANTFASYLLMPNIPFMAEVNKLFKENWITTGRLYHDYQPCNIRDCNVVVGALSSKFNVSQEAVIVRLKRANLYIEGERCNPLHEYMRRNSWW
ncbi:ImmA/IrrE family metallo-endopeptidase [Phocaeicola massiliensis]|uniref:ImmA/IrrE family metallo-endopeptidase n=1 Tax=Phocaeicola massiliensis TaxID=204516 RepID=UPI00189CEEE5|nr:ImmA/IrrE family metallo-endopeptidase [Phocaeicola massiliensis]